ncbi:unnamed protein product [Arabidopsis lyrata]|uniref:probable FBD-associated F-box protein At1g32375 n=1 Tax=Arabidopsis lyrata subsp. lyrata TaxID=81972 RepID=UPI000A29AA8D|nr:probable FBD-associated F-box protein At1g32375 [Arabidopsis lyrata subsp. lyrata]CAH8279872.1 unnamed protein product [Arabidopsis lyrata]|eukprot:XP_020871241.1 probable FBD-associated F-box protein At1g32375 [Arabidopsis lyrata subsp. lyrata]
MDSISELPDALLLKILSLLPTARDVVATMVLSKRWQPLWMMVPRLVYDDSYQNLEYGRFSWFVDKSLFLHEAPVIETLHFRLGKTCGSGDIRVWIRAADKCSVRRLILEFDSSSSASPAILPRSLYTGCRVFAILYTLQDAYPDGSIFCCLVFLTIGTWESEWLNLLMCVLKDSPNLRALKLEQGHSGPGPQPRPCWSEPSSIPECVISSLQTLEWTEYEGAEEEKEVVAFILRNGSCLKKVTISSKSTDRDKKLEMVKELAFLSRRSPTCHLTFE